MSDVLIQTRVSRVVAERFYRQAKREGISVAALARRIIAGLDGDQRVALLEQRVAFLEQRIAICVAGKGGKR